MNISVFSNLFQKKTSLIDTSKSLVLLELKKLVSKYDYELFENKTIYHRSEQCDVPLLLFIPYRGFVLFEYKTWSYKTLKKSKPKVSSHVEKNEYTLSYDNVSDFIKDKYNDISNGEDIDIFNFLILENISSSQYDKLDDDIKELLPKSRIFFQDCTADEMFKKLSIIKGKKDPALKKDIISFVFSQYMILSNKKACYVNKTQKAFIDSELLHVNNIIGKRISGKSSLIIQKAIYEKLKNRTTEIAIVSKKEFLVDNLKKMFLEFIEKNAVVLELSDVKIYSDKEFKNYHKTNKAGYDLIFIDDSDLFEENELEYYEKLQKNKKIVYINHKTKNSTVTLDKSYHKEIEYIKSDEKIYILKQIRKLVCSNENDIKIFAGLGESLKDLKDDIKSFCGLDIKINTYKKLPYQAKYIFLLDGCKVEYNLLDYLSKASKEKTFVIYNEKCDNIQKLKKERVV